MAHAGLSRYFSRRFYPFQVRQYFITGMPLTHLQRTSVFSSNLFQPLLKTTQIIAAAKLRLAWPQSFSSYDSLDAKSSISEEKGHPNRRTLYVGSLNFLTSERKLKDHFSRFGEIEKIRILHKTNAEFPNGYAFVIFKDAEALNSALKEEHHVDLRRVVVRRHDIDPQVESKIHIKNLPGEMSVQDITAHFSQFGHVNSVAIPWDSKTNKRMDFGFVLFSSGDSALKALEINSHNIQGNIIKASTNISKRRQFFPGQILVDGLPDDITLEDVKAYFEGYAPVDTIDMVFQRSTHVDKNFAFISFNDENVCNNILKDKHLINNKKVFVMPSSSTSNRRPLAREKKVFVEGIPLKKTKEDIHDFFNKFGDTSHVHLVDNWAKHHGIQCGIIKFKKKESVDNVLSLPQVDMNGCLLTVRRMGYTAETSSDFMPFYQQFCKIHRNTHARGNDKHSDFGVEAELKNHSGYPDLR